MSTLEQLQDLRYNLVHCSHIDQYEVAGLLRELLDILIDKEREQE